MLLSHKTTIKINRNYSNIIGHMCYAAYKLWNVCNYERVHYKELALPAGYPDWYYQKKAHKSDLWYKQLPSQTAQEVCKLLDNHGNLSIHLRRQMAFRTRDLQNSNMILLQLLICRMQ